MQIAIGMPIGYQSNAGRAAGAFDYLLNDTFTTNRAAGAVDGTAAEPGPGRRSVTDGNSKMSLSGGQLLFATGGVGNGDPGLWYGAIARGPGRLLVASVTPAAANKTVDVGWDSNQAGITDSYALLFRATGAMTARVSGTPAVALRDYTGGTTYPVAVILRTVGAMILVKSGGNWLLLWATNVQASNASPVYPNINALDAGATVDYIRVPAEKWLPTPLISDGFSVAGTSDGLGHAEGIAGGLGSGGAGLAWTSALGTWSAAAGVAAATALSAGQAIATVDCGAADLLISVNMTVPTATLAIVVRWTNESNFIMLRRTPTNLQLVKTIAGVATTVSDNASTYVAGAEVRLVCEGTKFRMFYNNAAVSTEQTIADAAVQSATVVGLRSGDTTCTADNFVAYARGTGGEHAALDAF